MIKKEQYTFKDWSELAQCLFWKIAPLNEHVLRNTLGRDLFQQSKIDHIIKEFLYAYQNDLELPHIELQWNTVLAVRLLFARDYFLTLHERKAMEHISFQWSDFTSSFDSMLNDMWHVVGLQWLLLYRACLPIAEECPDEPFCRLTRREMVRHEEINWWEIGPPWYQHGTLEYNFSHLKADIWRLRAQVSRGDISTGTDTLHEEDAKDEDADLPIIGDIASMFYDRFVYPVSAFRSDRIEKRLEFAWQYIDGQCMKFPHRLNITQNEAGACIALACTFAWHKCGLAWLKGVPRSEWLIELDQTHAIPESLSEIKSRFHLAKESRIPLF